MKALQTEAYNKGYSDGLDMAPPSHHDLKGTELDDYLQGYLDGQEAAIAHKRRNPGISINKG